MFSGNTYFQWQQKEKQILKCFHCLIKLLTAALQNQALEVILHKIQDSGSKNLFDFSFLARKFWQILATVMEKKDVCWVARSIRET